MLRTMALLVVFACWTPRLLAQARPPRSEEDLRSWLTNMTAHHRFTPTEVASATGLQVAEIDKALKRWGIVAGGVPKAKPDAPLLVIPYPGGRHPRIGFLEGAVNPNARPRSASSHPGRMAGTWWPTFPKPSGQTWA